MIFLMWQALRESVYRLAIENTVLIHISIFNFIQILMRTDIDRAPEMRKWKSRRERRKKKQQQSVYGKLKRFTAKIMKENSTKENDLTQMNICELNCQKLMNSHKRKCTHTHAVRANGIESNKNENNP